MSLSIIVAMDNNSCIGNNNELLWKIPADMKFFKETTTGHPIIMGKRTFLSIGRALPNRRNIVITRNKDFKHEGVEVINSIEEAVSLFKGGTEESFVIGGGEIYKQLLPFATKLYITRVHESFTGDTFFPHVDEALWHKEKELRITKGDSSPYEISFITYTR